MGLGAQAIATGHYARTVRVKEEVHLLKAIDELFESEEKVYRTKRKRKETVTEEEEKQFKIEQEEEDEFYQTAL